MDPADELNQLREQAQCCQNCDLYKHATQTIFGEGRIQSRVMLIGEQPGDKEDTLGHPFVGPAGKLLDTALAEADVPREECYVTNVVKHFKFEWRGTTRLHSTPRQIEVKACLPWLKSEIAVIKPTIIVCLGATAAQALLGSKFRVTKSRGQWIEQEFAPNLLATVHPSSILRADKEDREAQFNAFVGDLRVVSERMTSLRRAS